MVYLKLRLAPEGGKEILKKDNRGVVDHILLKNFQETLPTDQSEAINVTRTPIKMCQSL